MLQISINAILISNKSEYTDDKYIWSYLINLINKSETESITLINIDWQIIFEHGFYDKIKNLYNTNIIIDKQSTYTVTNGFIMNGNTYGVLSGTGKYKINHETYNILYNYELHVTNHVNM